MSRYFLNCLRQREKHNNKLKMQRDIERVDDWSRNGLLDSHYCKQTSTSIEQSRKSVVFKQSGVFVVPNNVDEIRVFAVGAPGGSGNGFGVLLNNGGNGGSAVSNIKVRPDESLAIYVGERGQDGALPKGGVGGCSALGFRGGAAATGNAGGGGGGGGASGLVRICGEEILLIAGGGGGGSGAGVGGIIGRAPTGGSFGTNSSGVSPEQLKRSNMMTELAIGSSAVANGCGGVGGGIYLSDTKPAESLVKSAAEQATQEAVVGLPITDSDVNDGIVVLSYTLATKLK